ncbi:hypothetical protein DER44DRAFT_355923 [Fusarium oxysporum]|nr:hypothetical protein DER44DRAFT_355923 [Fusarium oxysporum]
MINKKRRFAWYIYLELLFFKLYVLIFKDLAATIVSIYWGHFLYYHSFIPLPTSLAKVVNLLLSSVHGSYIIAGQWHAPTKLTALPNYACFAVQRLIYIYYCVTDTQQLGCVLEGQREPQTRQPWRANQAALSPPSHHQYHKISNCILIAFRSQGKTAFPPSQIELRLHISAGKIMKPAFYPILSAVVSFFANHQPSPAKPIVNCGCLVDHPSLKAKHGTQPPMAMLDKPGTLVDIRQAALNENKATLLSLSLTYRRAPVGLGTVSHALS